MDTLNVELNKENALPMKTHLKGNFQVLQHAGEQKEEVPGSATQHFISGQGGG